MGSTSSSIHGEHNSASGAGDCGAVAYQRVHGSHAVFALACSSLAKSMQPLQQFVAVNIGLALALQQICSCEVILQLLHCPAGQELKGADVSNL